VLAERSDALPRDARGERSARVEMGVAPTGPRLRLVIWLTQQGSLHILPRLSWPAFAG